jgi:hypothetical protein
LEEEYLKLGKSPLKVIENRALRAGIVSQFVHAEFGGWSN